MIKLVFLLVGVIFSAGVIAATEADLKPKMSAAEANSNWLLHGRDDSEQRFSPLKQINVDNIQDLALTWFTEVDSPDGLASTPIVVDGTIYLSGGFAKVFAYNGKTGKLLWDYDPKVRLDQSIGSSITARVNRGVAVWEGKVYVGTGDCRLIALDAKKGTVVWDIMTCDASKNYGITGAPRVAKGMVLIGNAGTDVGGTRGYISAYDATTGEKIWRFWTVPGDPAKGFENKAMAMAAKTWSGDSWWVNGGGSVWNTIVYDPELNQVYFGTDGAIPFDYSVRSPDGGDNLFTNSIVAVNADTGEYVWHYQEVPKDAWDFNANMDIMLMDMEVEGRTEKVMVHAQKNGFFYVIERKTGRLLSAEKFSPMNWATGVDMETGRPIEVPEARYYNNEDKTAIVYPSAIGAHNWHAMSYDASQGLVYLNIVDNLPSIYRAGFGVLGGIQVDLYGGADPDDPSSLKGEGRIIAWDPKTQTERWGYTHREIYAGGVMATAGKLVFQGTASAELMAFTSDKGQLLWTAPTGATVQAPPVSYAIDGEQYILLPVGRAGITRTAIPVYAPDAWRGPSRLLAFKLGGKAKLPPMVSQELEVSKPRKQQGNAQQIAKGKDLFIAGGCETCHGGGAVIGHGGSVPDLRYASDKTHEEWLAIVLGGVRRDKGMMPFHEYLTVEDAEALRAYVIDQQRKIYEKQQEKKP